MVFYGIVNGLALALEVVWVALGRPAKQRWGVPSGYLG
jgi:hypothetical protein